MKRVIIIGGDGFCGWPLALRCSRSGYPTLIIDNLSRRKIDEKEEIESLVPIQSLEERVSTWNQEVNLEGKALLEFKILDIAQNENYEELKTIFQTWKPTTVVHLAEQRSAPYSMKSVEARLYTERNNLHGNHIILNALIEVDPSIHLVHLGTMGVYGYGAVPDTVLPEGYLEVKMRNSSGEWSDPVEILHPSYPGSVYHLTKTQDALFFQFYVKNNSLLITDLHQGIVWGYETEETALHPSLQNRIDFDQYYGTVLNRFITQAAHEVPLTIYGTGGQTRAFIHIKNSVDCMILAIQNPPSVGDRVKIFNQLTETQSLHWLADQLKSWYPGTQIEYLPNPRKELESNDLQASNQQFLTLGLNPIYISKEEVDKIYQAAKERQKPDYKRTIYPSAKW